MTISLTQPQADEAGKVWGELRFTYADHELDHDPDTYLQLQTPHRERPKRPVWKELHSLRPELEPLRSQSEEKQLGAARKRLAQCGFAALPHHSEVLAGRGIDTQEDYTNFILENQE